MVHYEQPPVTGGDYGPIFMADNMVVTAIPELASLRAAGAGAALTGRLPGRRWRGSVAAKC